MQPHVNLGIRFRTHFEPFGFSPKRSKKPLQRLIQQFRADIKAGLLNHPASIDFVNEQIKEMRSLIRRIK